MLDLSILLVLFSLVLGAVFVLVYCGFCILDLGLWMLGFGFRFMSFRFGMCSLSVCLCMRVLFVGCIWDVGLWVWDLRSGIWEY